jgi:MYXO-CTERM domain-containing protein
MHALLLTLTLAAWPLPPDAGLADYARAENWPNDPAWKDQWPFFSSTGAGIDRAWSITRGKPSVVLAVVSRSAPFGEKRLLSRWALNLGELKLPRLADGTTATVFDLNADGRVDVRDYASDPRVSDLNGNGFVDPDDLRRAFADGVDDDHNGLTDDLCGWDFVANAPPVPTGSAAEFLLLAEPVNDGQAGAGACPECSLLPLVSDDTPDRLAAAIDCAQAQHSAVVLAPNVLGPSSHLRSSLSDGGVLVVSAGIDRRSWGLDWPSLHPATLAVSMIGDGTDFLVKAGCAGRGGQYASLVPSQSCARGSAALAAGIAGLVQSSSIRSPAALRGALTAPESKLDAFAALQSPEALIEFTAPGAFSEHPWAEPFEAKVRGSRGVLELSAAAGFDPPASSYVPVNGKVALAQMLATPADLTVDPHALTVTLRAVVREGTAVIAEARREVFLSQDPQLAPRRFALPAVGAATPQLVDLDHDGNDELVLADLDGRLHALDGNDEELLGYPLQLAGPVAVAPAIVFSPAGAPTFFSVSVDGVLEASGGFRAALGAPVRAPPLLASSPQGDLIVVADESGALHVRKLDGTAWPHSPFSLGSAPAGPLAVADFDDDGWPDLIAVAGGKATRVAITPDGLVEAAGWPISASSPGAALGDLDGDGSTEVVLDRVVNARGVDRLNFKVDGAIAGPIVLADLDGDGLRSAIVTERTDEGSRVHVFGLGDALAGKDKVAFDRPGWPRPLPDLPSAGGALVADLDGDGKPDVVTGQRAFSVYAWNRTGAPLSGFPRSSAGTITGLTLGWAARSAQLVAITSDGAVLRWAVRGLPTATQWETAGHDVRHTSNADTPFLERPIVGLGEKFPKLKGPGCGCHAGEGEGVALLLIGFSTLRRRKIC